MKFNLPEDLDKLNEMSHSRCCLKPRTYNYFVATEFLQIGGQGKLVFPGDFVVIFSDRLQAYSPVEFEKQFDICYKQYMEDSK